MMPTFPSSPLKFRTVSFPQYGFKAGISGEAFPARGVFPSAGLPSSFVPIAYHVLLPVQCRGTRCACAPPCEQLLPLYPRGPRFHQLLAPSSLTDDAGLRPLGTVSALPSTPPSPSREATEFRRSTTVRSPYDLPL